MKRKAKRIATELSNDTLEVVAQMLVDEADGIRYDVYADGSCRDGVGGCGWIVLHKGAIVKVGKTLFSSMHNDSVDAELRAVIHALGDCPFSCSVDVYVDCQVVMGKIQAGKVGVLADTYNKVCDGKVIRFHWVKAHDGNELNEMVDSLAYSAILGQNEG